MIYAYPRFLQVFGYNKWINTGCALHSKDTLREAFAFSVCYSDSVKGVESVLAFADGKSDFTVIFVIHMYFSCILYILCNRFYLMLKTLYMEVFISCHFTYQFKDQRFKLLTCCSLPNPVYLTRDCCDMEMKILYQKKKKNIWVFSFCLWKLKMF